METYTRQVSQTVAVQDDPAARALLRQAFESTARWRHDFPGFTATLVGYDDGREHRGTLKVTAPQTVDVCFTEAAFQTWAQHQMASSVGHRAYRTFDESDGRYVLTLAERDGHPLGRRIHIHGDGMNSCYRVRDDRIWQIERTMRQVKFTIAITDTTASHEGTFLTTRFTVYFFATETGQLTQVESFADEYTAVQGIILPRSRRVTFAEDGAVKIRALTLHDHALLGLTT